MNILETSMEWHSNLPDVREWQPRSNQSITLSNGLLLACQSAQSRIVSEAGIEKAFNIDNFDSGVGVEDIVRQEISKLLPDRYSTDAGVVNDRDGRTAGDYDVIIRNSLWAPVTKLGATPNSRRYHFPIESVYAAVEIKQTLTFSELDKAMQKLVVLSRLNRPTNPYGHITENQHLRIFDVQGQTLNPLHTTILATAIGNDIAFRDLAYRFDLINANLQRHEMVTGLYVLDHGSVSYSTQNDDDGYIEADFMRDSDKNLVFGISDKTEHRDKVFYVFYVSLLGHLTRSVLAVHDLAPSYGSRPSYDFFINDHAMYNET